MSNAPSKPVSFSRPKVGYFSNRPRTVSAFVGYVIFSESYCLCLQHSKRYISGTCLVANGFLWGLKFSERFDENRRFLACQHFDVGGYGDHETRR